MLPSTSIRRRAILIEHPGPKERSLPGVGHDLRNISGFLQTPRGGGWLPREIIVLNSPMKAQVLAAIQEVEADYLFVYFAGHGAGQLDYVWENEQLCVVGQRWLELANEEFIRDLDLLSSRVSRQHVICDCCRCRIGARISGIPEIVEQVAYTAGEIFAAREHFGRLIQDSPGGKTITHSTLDGMPARDTDDGGKFTVTILEGALYWQTGFRDSPISLDMLVDYARAVMDTGENGQIPEMVYLEGAVNVPFALDTTWPTLTGRDTSASKDGIRLRSPVGNTGPEVPKRLLAAGGIAFALWLFGGFD